MLSACVITLSRQFRAFYTEAVMPKAKARREIYVEYSFQAVDTY